MRKSAYEKVIEARRKKTGPAETFTMDDLFLLLLDGNRPRAERQANPTQRDYAFDQTRIALYMGPAGCAKTSTICAGGFLRSIFQPGSKGLIARANYNDLIDTTMLRMQEMLGRLPKGALLDRDKAPPAKWYIDTMPVMSPEGDILCDDPSQITFMGLTDSMGSYEFDWAKVDEIAEVEEMRFHEIDTRLRNRPSSWPEGYTAYKLGGAFNPTDVHHWLYTACTGKNHEGRKIKDPYVKLYIPQPRENTRNLPPGYYENLRRSLPKDMADRLIDGQWGASFDGQPVYKEFSYDHHAMDGIYDKFDPHGILLRFWDFGYRHPVCLWAQIDVEGRLLILREKIGENIDIDAFSQLCLTLTKQWFPNFPGARDVMDYGDPAARQKKDTGSTITALSRNGINLRYKISSIDEGLRLIRVWLTKMISHQPAIQIDRKYCPTLVSAMRGGYRYPKEVGGSQDVKPLKDGVYDHPADAFRYGVINVLGGGIDFASVESMPASVEYQRTEDDAIQGKLWAPVSGMLQDSIQWENNDE